MLIIFQIKKEKKRKRKSDIKNKILLHTPHTYSLSRNYTEIENKKSNN